MIRTYLDAGVLIAAVRKDRDLAEQVLRLMFDPDRAFVSSAFVRLEILPKATYFGRTVELDFYRRYFARVVDWAGPLEAIVAMAEREAEQYGLSALDALHVAAAVLLDADELVTTEGPRKPIHRVAGVKVVGV